ncbi:MULTISPECIES: hypothetical protein [Bacillus]|uniref:hypothetical protein n=1 Tax=Bacillus TaxID=1386 RepID=UPI0008FDEB26|nr:MULTISPECIES: hypothetical protein [Bacillus cereus group]MCU5490370.1 hypothetical protein [Bacillus cereus]MDF9468487.1 hypothetical protein [Bacillus cereus]MED3622255.1 hypothetical protein [Bacillus thuringiensis]OJE07562.1 hypothetical protein A9489_15230 [Bacillus thuringiensis]PEA61443.1 hypothetical protein CON74_07685 [Bacillus thuringiensis]
MSDKKRESFFWNLKKIENEEFFKWFESQSNIADSLYKLVCYFIDKHGLQDVADYKIQQQMQKEILLQDKDFLNDVKRILLNNSNLTIQKESQAIEEEVADSNRIISSTEKNSTSKDTHIENESTTEKAVLKDEYEDLDTANLFGN